MSRLLVVAVGLVAGAGWAGDWAHTFPPAAVAPWMPAWAKTYLVAGAGGDKAETKAAALALADGVRRGGLAQLVMTDEALGDLTLASDEAVLGKCKVMPVELVAVLRVFPGSGGAEPISVVTVYDKAGASRGSFSCTRGQPCPGPEGGLGMRGAVEPPRPPPPRAEPTPPAPPPPPPDPKEVYAARYLWFEGDAKNEKPEGDLDAVLRGTRKRPLEGTALYQALGRKDLAEAYQTRGLLKLGAGVGGLAALVGAGALYWTASNSPCVKALYTAPGSQPDSCLQRTWPDMTLPAIGLGLVGVGLIGTGVMYPMHPVDGATARKLIDEHNRKLKVELGLSAALLPGGGAVAVGGAF